MDPCRRPSPARRRGLPRTRGDGPVSPAARIFCSWASPHPRGWTPVRRIARPHRTGFPAPAGMDLLPDHRICIPPGLPRTRGDGPGGIGAVRSLIGASPHPRGWTLTGIYPRVGASGFPAPAGMDPVLAPVESSATGLPRTRGDGPATHTGRVSPARASRTRGDGPVGSAWINVKGEASPHPRGWTSSRKCSGCVPPGFPAPAGMDPAGRAVRQAARGLPAPAGMDLSRRMKKLIRQGLPRTRGDGPGGIDTTGGQLRASPHPRGWTLDIDGNEFPKMASPHPRGWTLVSYHPDRDVPGFPAPAGMDPWCRSSVRYCPWLPRTRGDGPWSATIPTGTSRASPHPRGWTHGAGHRSAIVHGFPAPAGMDRGRRAPARWTCGLPRTRGDGPSCGVRITLRGWASPHPRGWTPVAQRARAGQVGFPAPAGMDPLRAAPVVTRRRLPRTRGDGPCGGNFHAAPVWASPHPRGWTQLRATLTNDVGGFPAPAGWTRPRR